MIHFACWWDVEQPRYNSPVFSVRVKDQGVLISMPARFQGNPWNSGKWSISWNQENRVLFPWQNDDLEAEGGGGVGGQYIYFENPPPGNIFPSSSRAKPAPELCPWSESCPYLPAFSGDHNSCLLTRHLSQAQGSWESLPVFSKRMIPLTENWCSGGYPTSCWVLQCQCRDWLAQY